MMCNKKWLVSKQDRRESVGYQYRDSAGEAGQRWTQFSEIGRHLEA
jgi:hypothetical protein